MYSKSLVFNETLILIELAWGDEIKCIIYLMSLTYHDKMMRFGVIFF